MEQNRYLLPFTCDVDTQAIRSALVLAKVHNATLVGLALHTLSKGQGPENIRLEYLQQAQDFLSVLETQAAIQSVPVELYTDATHDISASISYYTKNMRCQRVILSYAGEKAHFLREYEAQQLRQIKAHPIHVLYTHPTPKKTAGRGLLATLATQVAASFL